MKYVMAFSSTRPPALLEDASTRSSTAQECREAALGFMGGVAVGWDKIDLALWLTGPYARATRHSLRGERVAGLGHDEIAEDTIEDLLVRTRGQVLASLERASLAHGALDFVDELVSRGLVRRARCRTPDAAWDAPDLEPEYEDVWVPVDAPRARLRDRVAALFAADYLNDPDAYAELFVCHRCEAVVFDRVAKRLGVCGSHRISGLVPRDESSSKVAGDE
jgi:hypothetical protein